MALTYLQKEFYEKLIENDELPSTSLVSPSVFEDEYIKAQQNNEALLVITVSSKLSETFQSASLTADDYDDVYVVDSKSVAVGENISYRSYYQYPCWTGCDCGCVFYIVITTAIHNKKGKNPMTKLDLFQNL